MKNTGEYTVKGYNELETNRGIAWGANIYKGNLKVGRVDNAGNGGCTDITLPDENKSELMALSQNISIDDIYESDLEGIVNALCDNFQELKHYKPKMKTKTFFQKKSDGRIYGYNVKYNEDVKQMVIDKGNNDIEFILNEAVLRYGSNVGKFFSKDAIDWA
jgi:hypothetical protein